MNSFLIKLMIAIYWSRDSIFISSFHTDESRASMQVEVSITLNINATSMLYERVRDTTVPDPNARCSHNTCSRGVTPEH